jgi:hypothetical protein
MHGTALGDLRKPYALVVCQRPRDLERALDLIETYWPILALLLVGRMRAAMVEPHDHALERPLLSVGVHAERDRRASAEGGEDEIVRRGSLVGAAGFERFVRDERVASGIDAHTVSRPPDTGGDRAFVPICVRGRRCRCHRGLCVEDGTRGTHEAYEHA